MPGIDLPIIGAPIWFGLLSGFDDVVRLPSIVDEKGHLEFTQDFPLFENQREELVKLQRFFRSIRYDLPKPSFSITPRAPETFHPRVESNPLGKHL